MQDKDEEEQEELKLFEDHQDIDLWGWQYLEEDWNIFFNWDIPKGRTKHIKGSLEA